MKQSSRYLSLFFISFFLFVFSSQAQTYEWVQGGGSTEALAAPSANEEMQYMCTDANGNVYALGILGNNPITADTFMMAAGAYGAENNIFVASYNCSGQMRWAKLIGSANLTKGYGIVADNQGHIYVSGSFVHIGAGHTLYIGYDTTISTNLYLATGLIEFDTSGHFNWIRFVGANTSASLTALGSVNDPLVIDGEDNPHFICNVQSGVPLTPTITSQYGIYDLKYDATGTLLSAIRLQHDSTLILSGATIDKQSDKLYIYGTRGDDFMSTMSFHQYLAAFNMARNMIWEDTLADPTAEGSEGFGAILADGMGHLYASIAGATSVVYQGDTVRNYVTTGYLSFIMKLDTDGHPRWIQNYGANTSINYFYGLTFMPNNKIAATGTMAGMIVSGTDTVINYSGEGQNCYFTILDTAGHVQTIQQIHGSGFYDAAYAIASDNVGSLYIGGAVADNIWGGSLTPYTSVGGNTDFFVMKYGYDCSCTSAPAAAFTDTGTHTIGATYTGTTTGLDSVVWNFGDGYTTTVVPPVTGAVHTYSVAGTYNVCVTAYTECGSDEHCGNVVVHIHTAGVAGINFSNVNVYPNPANDELNITGLMENTNYRLLNVAGSCVGTGILQRGSNSISMSNVMPGVYVLELVGENGEKDMVRVVKE